MNSDRVLKGASSTNTIILIAVVVLSILFLGLVIYSRQGTLTNQQARLADWAEDIGADRDQFINDFLSEEIAQVVTAQDQEYVERFGESKSTPTIILDGDRVSRDNLSGFVDLINAEIAETEADPNEELPVVLEDFSDFNCPHCADFDVIAFQLGEIFTEDQLSFQSKNLAVINQTTSIDYAKAYESAKLQGFGSEMRRRIFQEVHPDNANLYVAPTIETSTPEIIDESPVEIETENSESQPTVE